MSGNALNWITGSSVLMLEIQSNRRVLSWGRAVSVLFEKEHSLQHQRWMRWRTELGYWRVWMMSPVSSRKSVPLGLWSTQEVWGVREIRSSSYFSPVCYLEAISSVSLPKESHLPSQCTYCSLFSLLGSLRKQTNKKQLSLTGLVPAAAAAKSLQSCPTLCGPIDGSPLGSPVPGILQARTLEWVAISFSNAWKWKVKVKSPSHVRLFETPWTTAYQAPPSMGFSRQEYLSGVPLPSPRTCTTQIEIAL